MKTVFCNVNVPSTVKIAVVTGNKLTRIHTRQGKLYCYLNGKLMLASEARKQMLENVTLVNSSGYPCEV